MMFLGVRSPLDIPTTKEPIAPLPATRIHWLVDQRPEWAEKWEPMATIQKSVLRAISVEVRPREPVSRARDRQGSMDTALGFHFLGQRHR